MTMTADEKKEVLRLLGDIPEEVYDELVNEMRAQARSFVPKMREAAARADYPALKALCHSVKGTAANLRRTAIAAAAAGLESMALDPSMGALISGKIDEFENLLAAG